MDEFAQIFLLNSLSPTWTTVVGRVTSLSQLLRAFPVLAMKPLCLGQTRPVIVVGHYWAIQVKLVSLHGDQFYSL